MIHYEKMMIIFSMKGSEFNPYHWRLKVRIIFRTTIFTISQIYLSSLKKDFFLRLHLSKAYVYFYWVSLNLITAEDVCELAL